MSGGAPKWGLRSLWDFGGWGQWGGGHFRWRDSLSGGDIQDRTSLELGGGEGAMQIRQAGTDYGDWGGAMRKVLGLAVRQGDCGWAASKQY